MWYISLRTIMMVYRGHTLPQRPPSVCYWDSDPAETTGTDPSPASRTQSSGSGDSPPCWRTPLHTHTNTHTLLRAHRSAAIPHGVMLPRVWASLSASLLSSRDPPVMMNWGNIRINLIPAQITLINDAEDLYWTHWGNTEENMEETEETEKIWRKRWGNTEDTWMKHKGNSEENTKEIWRKQKKHWWNME